MDQVIQIVTNVNDALNAFIWGPVMLFAFLFVGLLFSVRTHFFQVTHFKEWFSCTILSVFNKNSKQVLKTKDPKAISQFQSVCASLAATIGTGNITGVATAITAGGPGAIFWMWIAAFLGMMTNYAEIVLGIRYRYKNEKNSWIGGAMVYMERGLGWKWLAVLFSFSCILASFGMGNMAQASSIASGLSNSFHIPPQITALFVMFFVGITILGGIKRLASFTEKLVPFMGILYVSFGLFVIISNWSEIPNSFSLIITEAFNLKTAGSGFLGYGISIALQKGVSRGIFSNEAGLGSSVMLHTASDAENPCTQGMWGIFQVFTDTLIICTITALVILSSGVYHMEETLRGIHNGEDILTGTALTSHAFQTVIPFGGQFVAIMIMLFAFATLLGWSYYGERCVEYLFGLKAVLAYKIIFIAFIYIGCTISLDLVWEISDTFNGFMAVPNLIAITLLSNEVIQLTKSNFIHKK